MTIVTIVTIGAVMIMMIIIIITIVTMMTMKFGALERSFLRWRELAGKEELVATLSEETPLLLCCRTALYWR